MKQVQAIVHYAAVFSMLLVCTAAGCNSGDGARVSGTVKTASGEPLLKARVTARSPETGAWASGISDEQGHFSLTSEASGDLLPLGTYNVIVVEDRGDWDHPNRLKAAGKYGELAYSGLQLVVDESGETTLDLTLDPP